MSPLLIIPARLGAQRLPRKPLADIHGVPMILHTWKRAQEANVGRVLIACAEPELVEVVQAAGAEAVLTDPSLPSGTDRVYAAWQQVDPAEKTEIILNIQGDLPTLAPATVQAVMACLQHTPQPIATAAAPITEPAEAQDPNVVKIALEGASTAPYRQALYFSRAPIPYGGPYYHHIGLYGFRAPALKKFVALPPSGLEKQERLEQLRAMEAGMQLSVAMVSQIPISVDTPEDLEKARHALRP